MKCLKCKSCGSKDIRKKKIKVTRIRKGKEIRVEETVWQCEDCKQLM